MSAYNKKLGIMNSLFHYRVRARNECGWSPYSAEMPADLIDKISCKSPRHKAPNRHDDTYYGISRSLDGLLPHAITLRSESEGNLLKVSSPGDTCRSVQKKTQKKKVAGLISNEDKYHILHEDMLSIPPRIVETAESKANLSSRSSPQKSNQPLAAEGSTKYGHNPVLSSDSTLAGESLEGVNSALESWLCRLSEACPLDEHSRSVSNHNSSLSLSLDWEDTVEYEGDDDNQKVVSLSLSERNTRQDDQQISGSTGNMASGSVSPQSFKTPVLDTLYTEAGMNPKQIRMKQPPRKRVTSGIGLATANDRSTIDEDEESIVLKLARVHIDTHGIKEPAMVPSKLLPNKMFTLR